MSELSGLETPGLQVIQLLCGEDVATDETAELGATPQAVQLNKAVFKGAAKSQNFIYLIVDTATKDCALVDAGKHSAHGMAYHVAYGESLECFSFSEALESKLRVFSAWDTAGLLRIVQALELNLVAALVKHCLSVRLLSFHCPFTVLSLPFHCPFTVLSLPFHRPFTAFQYTHRHSDHTGGRYSDDVRLQGLPDLALQGIKSYLAEADVEATVEQCSIGGARPSHSAGPRSPSADEGCVASMR